MFVPVLVIFLNVIVLKVYRDASRLANAFKTAGAGQYGFGDGSQLVDIFSGR